MLCLTNEYNAGSPIMSVSISTAATGSTNLCFQYTVIIHHIVYKITPNE
jgi:hypothetical protein